MSCRILEGDQEAFDIWHRTIGLSPDRIVPRGLDDNFWSMGDGEGPCGPCTEIFWDRTPGDDRLGDDRSVPPLSRAPNPIPWRSSRPSSLT